tara:strand:- start:889 stop:1686 length:798 start_codon:yes stop_codon:yes gene_type:complete
MAETTHEALVRQVAATEEMLAYFQGQRDQFQANVAQAEADYEELSSNLIGVVRTEMSRSYYVSYSGSDANDGRSDASPFATLEKVFNVAPKGGSVDVYIESDELNPFVVNSCTVLGGRVTLRPLVNHGTCYLKWRGVINCIGGSLHTIYRFEVDYDFDEYNGYLFNVSQLSAVAIGGFNSWDITIKNTSTFSVANSVYTKGGFCSIYLARINFLDEIGDPYQGTTTIFNRGSGEGFAAYELWQCSLGPNFVHAGTAMGTSSYIVG